MSEKFDTNTWICCNCSSQFQSNFCHFFFFIHRKVIHCQSFGIRTIERTFPNSIWKFSSIDQTEKSNKTASPRWINKRRSGGQQSQNWKESNRPEIVYGYSLNRNVPVAKTTSNSLFTQPQNAVKFCQNENRHHLLIKHILCSSVSCLCLVVMNEFHISCSAFFLCCWLLFRNQIACKHNILNIHSLNVERTKVKFIPGLNALYHKGQKHYKPKHLFIFFFSLVIYYNCWY